MLKGMCTRLGLRPVVFYIERFECSFCLKDPCAAKGGTQTFCHHCCATALPGLSGASVTFTKVYVLVYVDDILVASKSLEDIQHVKHRLTEVFKVRDLGEAKYFLGMDLDGNKQAKTLKLTQERLATELVSKYGMMEGKAKSAPMSTSIKLVQATEDGQGSLQI